MINTQRKRLSVRSVISMIGAMIFAIAMFCMVFLPVLSSSGQGFAVSSSDSNVLDLSTMGDDGKNLMNKTDEQIEYYADLMASETTKNLSSDTQGPVRDTIKSDFIFMLKAMKIDAVLSTVIFFAVMAAVLMVILGKALQFTRGGRKTASVFGWLGTLLSVGYLGYQIFISILMTSKFNSWIDKLVDGLRTTYSGIYSSSDIDRLIEMTRSQVNFSVGPGIGPILMAVFAIVTLVFVLLASNERSAFTVVGGRAANPYNPAIPYTGYNPNMPVNGMNQPVNNGYQPPMNGMNQPVNNPYAPQQNGNPYGQPPVPVQPVIQPDPMPLAPQPPQAAPAPLMQEPNLVDDDPPTVAQAGVVEGVAGDFAAQVVNLRPGQKIFIGRDANSCQIVLPANRTDISRTHCSVKYDPYTDSFKVIDMSSNGTFVNGQRLTRDQETAFPSGTVLALGSGENQFRLRKM